MPRYRFVRTPAYFSPSFNQTGVSGPQALSASR